MKKLIGLSIVFSSLLLGSNIAFAASATVLTTTLPNALVNAYYSTRITFSSDATFGTVDVSVKNLPPGIDFLEGTPQTPNALPTSIVYGLTQKDNNGNYYITLAGTPTVQGGTYVVTVNIFDPVHTFDVTQTYNLSVVSAPSFVTTSLPTATVGQPYSARILVFSNFTTPPNIVISNLPSGIYLVNQTSGSIPPALFGTAAKDANGNYYADLAGTVNSPVTSTVKIQLYDTVHTYDVSKDFSFTTVAANPPRANGSNVLFNGTVYFIQNGVRRPYTSAGAFLSYGFNSWANVATANSADVALPVGNFVPPRDGSLINDHGTIWVISNGARYGFTTMQAFQALGYSLSNVVVGDASFLTQGFLNIDGTDTIHKAGTLLNDNGTIYLVINNQLYGFPSMVVFTGWGYSLKQVIKINAQDKVWLQVSGGLRSRESGELNLY